VVFSSPCWAFKSKKLSRTVTRATRLSSPLAPPPKRNSRRIQCATRQVKAGGFVAHEFSHLFGLDDNHGNVLSNSFNPAMHPDMRATGLDFQWAFGPELKANQQRFTVGQREGLNWLTGNNRGNRKWWEGYTSRSTNQ
jgi:hypothetical protein